MYRLLISLPFLTYFAAIGANAQDATLSSVDPATTAFSTAIPTVDASSLLSGQAASLSSVEASAESSVLASEFPSTNPYARACITYMSVADKCSTAYSTLTAPAAIESAATSCYCEMSSSLQNGAFDAILSSCDSYVRTAFPTTASAVSVPTIVCNGHAGTPATATATATSGGSTSGGSSSAAASSKPSAAAANTLPIGNVEATLGALTMGLFTFLRLFL